MTVVGYEAVTEPVSVPVAPAKAARRHRTPIVLSIAAVIVMLVAVGAYAGVRMWTGAGIAEPETAVPASTAAFARIDLNPGLRDKVTFDGLTKKFPTNGKSTSSLVTELEKSIASKANLDYDTDVKPWFDGRAGIGEWTNPSNQPVALLVLASKNDAVAKATLTKIGAKLGESFGFVVRDGYALVAGAARDAQADATAAAAEAEAHSLADTASFTSTVRHLSGNNLVLAYVDLGKVGPLLARVFSSQLNGLGGGVGGVDGSNGTGALGGGLGMLGAIASGESNALNHLTGTIAVGASVVDDGIEIRVHSQGMAATGTPLFGQTNVRPTVDAMPDSTILGVAFNGLDPNSATAKHLDQSISGLLGGGLASGLFGNSNGGGTPEAQALAQLVSGALTTVVTSKVISIAYSGIDAGLPNLLIAADTGDQSKAASLLSTINQLTHGASIPGVQITQDGTRVQATIGTPPTGGRLGDSALYRETMAGMSHAGIALYLDVQKLITHGSPTNRTFIASVKAIGMTVSLNRGGVDELIRIVIKK